MKNTLSFVALAALLLATGCSSTGTANTASNANTAITLEQAYQQAQAGEGAGSEG